MKRVLLVNTNTEQAPYPVAPLGLCLLASSLEATFEVKLFDGVFEKIENLKTAVHQFRPDYIGFSIRNVDNMVKTNPKEYTDQLINTFIKPVQKIATVPVILGGSGFSIFPNEWMKLTGADYGIIGEGEQALLNLLKCLESGKTTDGLPEIITKDSFNNTISASTPYDLGKLPFSEMYRKIDFEPYRRRGSYSIQTKRGCYHRCIYCTYPVIEGGQYRLRPPQAIVDEIEKANEQLGDIIFEFIDSTFNDPPGHAEAICREIIRRKLKIRLRTMGINPRHTSAELFDLMRKAGFAQIDCTPDSASPRMIANLDKNFNLKELENTARLIQQSGMPTMWFFLFGGPGENAQTLDETFSFIEKWVCKYDMAHLSAGLRIYPQTRLCDIALAEKIIKSTDSLLKPVFYISGTIGEDELYFRINQFASKNPNGVPAWESTPTPEMLKEAMEMQSRMKFREPLFRTLLRLRYKMYPIN